MEILKIDWDTIYPMWVKMWNKTTIGKRSGRLLLEGFDQSIILNENIKTTFFGAFEEGKLVGVNSGYSPMPKQYRSRGLYVLPEYRLQGIAEKLLMATEKQAKDEGHYFIWTMPRESALNVYIKAGFKVISNFYEGEFGKNCFAMKVIK